MALVHVADGRADPQGLQGADAADAQQDFLLDAHLQITAIQLVGDVLILTTVGRDVGIQQEEGQPSDLGAPHLGRDLAAGVINLHRHRRSVFPLL